MSNIQLQLQTGFIDRLADNDTIAQRVTDGYFNATAMCKSARKKIFDYGRLATTKAFLNELSSKTGIPASGSLINRLLYPNYTTVQYAVQHKNAHHRYANSHIAKKIRATGLRVRALPMGNTLPAANMSTDIFSA